MNTDTNFGLKIRQLIDSRGMTVEEAAEKLGYTKAGLYPITHKKDVSTAFLKKVAKAFGVDIGYFFAGNGNVLQSGNYNTVGQADFSNGKPEGLRVDALLLQKEVEQLKEQLKAKDREMQLLREMVEILKSKGK